MNNIQSWPSIYLIKRKKWWTYHVSGNILSWQSNKTQTRFKQTMISIYIKKITTNKGRYQQSMQFIDIVQHDVPVFKQKCPQIYYNEKDREETHKPRFTEIVYLLLSLPSVEVYGTWFSSGLLSQVKIKKKDRKNLFRFTELYLEDSSFSL